MDIRSGAKGRKKWRKDGETHSKILTERWFNLKFKFEKKEKENVF
jgi:hypothetical protein